MGGALVCAGIFVTGAFAQDPVRPRAALVATAMNADSEKYLDVAVAELTARSDLEQVERQAIRQVLGEPALALQQDALGVAAGQLLRADVVGMLEMPPDGECFCPEDLRLMPWLDVELNPARRPVAMLAHDLRPPFGEGHLYVWDNSGYTCIHGVGLHNGGRMLSAPPPWLMYAQA